MLSNRSALTGVLGAPREARQTVGSRKTRRWLMAGAVIFVIAGGAGAFVVMRPAAAPTVTATEPAVPVLTVSTMPVDIVKMADTLLVNGSLSPWEDLILGSEVSGLAILQMRVEEGDWVKAGQPLAKLDDSLLQAQLKETDAQIAKSQAMLKIDQSDVKRAQELLKTSAISVQTAELRQATAQSAEADLAYAEAQHGTVLAQLAQTEIRAPADGFISKRTARIGRVVTAGEELFREVRDGVLELDAEVPDRLLSRVQPGQEVKVTRDDGSVIVGRVRAIAPLVDTSSRNGIVHVRFAANPWLKAGMFVSGELILGDADTLAVPESAVMVKDGHAQVFQLGPDSKVVLRSVETGQRSEGKVAIRKGLSAGQQVVTVGAGFLRDGDLVRVVDKSTH